MTFLLEIGLHVIKECFIFDRTEYEALPRRLESDKALLAFWVFEGYIGIWIGTCLTIDVN